VTRGHRLITILGVVVWIVAATPAQAADKLRLGFFDSRPFIAADGAQWLSRAQAAGAGVARISIYWRTVAPLERPTGFDPADPSMQGYRWDALDAAVKALIAAGMEPLVTVLGAPAWAQGPGRPASARDGTWKPDADELAAFLHAAATRYSGRFADPRAPDAALPRVRQWQVWNEPNLATYLTPQWEHRDGRLAPASPENFRALLNAGYAAIKAVQPDATVVAGGTAPYGDPQPGGQRIAPALFLRELFCLRGRSLRTTSCPGPTSFDAYDHHPYGVAAPTRKALNTDDVATPDLGKLTRVVRRAVRIGRAAPRAAKPLWITETSYDSNPPDPQGVPLSRHAEWLEQNLYLLWKQGVRTILWFSIVDEQPKPSYDTTYQSGLYFLDGTPKPAATAFTFPLVREGRRLWGRPPADGPVVIERRAGGRWQAIARVAGRRHRPFRIVASVPETAVVRARQGTTTSLAWPLGS
jgi:hypothetical protein